jgi:uncharacterized protein
MTRRLMIAGAIAGVLLAMAGTADAAEPFPLFAQPVVDAAGVVADATERLVDAELIDYQARSGNQIAVAVVNTTGSRSIEDYAIDLGRSWGVGQKDKDSGVLLVIAYRDRTLRIEVGRGLEGKLTDLQSGRIIRERLVPLFKRGDVGAAVIQGTQAIRTELGDTQAGTLPPALGAGERGGSTSGQWLLLPALLGIGALTVLGRRHRGGRGGRGRPAGNDDALVWGAALAALAGLGGHGGFGGGGGGRRGGFGGGGGGFGGGGASGGW